MPRSFGPGSNTTAGTILAEVQINRSGAESGAGQPIRDQDPRTSAIFLERAVRSGGPRARARRSVGPAQVPRPAAGPAYAAHLRCAGRLRPGAQAAQHAAEIGQGLGVRGSAVGTLDIWDERLVELGSEIIDERAGAGRASRRAAVGRAYQAVAGEDHGPALRPHARVSSARTRIDGDGWRRDRLDLRGGSRRLAGRRHRPPGATADAASARRWPACAARNSTADLTLAGRIATTSSSCSTACPRKGYASHGESWSFALALKLAAAELLRAGLRQRRPGADPR